MLMRLKTSPAELIDLYIAVFGDFSVPKNLLFSMSRDCCLDHYEFNYTYELKVELLDGIVIYNSSCIVVYVAIKS